MDTVQKSHSMNRKLKLGNPKKNVNVLDVCCGDSYILDYIKNSINNYVGIDNNSNYLKNSKKKFPKFSFINSDIEKIHKIKKLNRSKINFIFINV